MKIVAAGESAISIGHIAYESEVLTFIDLFDETRRLNFLDY